MKFCHQPRIKKQMGLLRITQKKEKCNLGVWQLHTREGPKKGLFSLKNEKKKKGWWENDMNEEVKKKKRRREGEIVSKRIKGG
jgi:hypothetical protein